MTAITLPRSNHFLNSNLLPSELASGQFPSISRNGNGECLGDFTSNNKRHYDDKTEKPALKPIDVNHRSSNNSTSSAESSPTSTSSVKSKSSFVGKFVSPAKKIFNSKEPSQSKSISRANSYKSTSSNKGFSDSCTCELTKYGRLDGPVLGKGAWGIVKTIERRSDGKLFAVKQFRSRDSSETPRSYAKTILAEYTIASLLHHQHIIETLDFIVQDGRYYQIMEYCPTDLFSAMKTRKNTLKPEKIDTWFKQVVSAVSYMHKIGVVHRDIKGENILLDAQDNAKLIDFGLADVYKTAFENTPRPSKGKSGSCPYIAPEVHINSKSYDGRKVDSWSLGVLYLTLQLGVFPWQSAVSTDSNYAGYIGRKNCLDRTILNRLTPERSSLVHRLLEPNPELRLSVEEALEHDALKAIPI
ncbi:kinase-like protein [Basidiobolus meristosporus CBS 931.73]|uniref:Kinase-like protein n=1 Tax=Basidiobolus meristosporus CBS 931.73 TaxID=1314790 RepID=A0A1Y1YDF7_9FUNG|nr:kinase-like protein [Basidiobolus meristosporus CBS 931.73]|eukprot:ORX95953.1 kinase-like protein [Basidiobolus meristosporus CBS 931.73]